MKAVLSRAVGGPQSLEFTDVADPTPRSGEALIRVAACGVNFPDALIIEVTGDSGKVQALLRVLEPFGIKELAQSGLLAMGRGSKSITDRVFRTP